MQRTENLRPVHLLSIVLLVGCGCQQVQLRERAVQLASTSPDLFQQQVLDNLALLAAKPDAMPYYLLPSQGTEQIARTLQVQYTPGWDFITSMSKFAGQWLFDKQGAQIQGTNQNQQTWQMFPVSDPDKLILMRSALRKATGFEDQYWPKVKYLFQTYAGWAKYLDMVQDGWLIVGNKKDAPKRGCLVAHYCDVYVWVLPDAQEKLANLTLAILDILTIDGNGASATLAALEKKRYLLQQPKIDALSDPPATQNIKNRLRDLIDIPFNTLGEFRQAIRKILTDAKVKDNDIETILSEIEKTKVTIYVLTDDIIEKLPDPPFTKAIKMNLKMMPVKMFESRPAFQQSVQKAFATANITDEDIAPLVEKLERLTPKEVKIVETFRVSQETFTFTPRITPVPIAPPPASTPP